MGVLTSTVVKWNDNRRILLGLPVFNTDSGNSAQLPYAPYVQRATGGHIPAIER